MGRTIGLLKMCLIGFLLILPNLYLSAQERKWPIRYSKRIDNGAPIKEGLIVLRNSDSLKGIIKLLPFALSYPLLDTTTNKILDIYVRDISLMRIYHTTPDGPFSDFISLNYKHFLWRLLGKRNNVAIYDNELNGGILKLLLVTPVKRMWLYNNMTWFFHANMDYLLIRFINNRYQTSLKEEDFRATQDMIQYILDKEDVF
jgi:hypothetical protein